MNTHLNSEQKSVVGEALIGKNNDTIPPKSSVEREPNGEKDSNDFREDQRGSVKRKFREADEEAVYIHRTCNKFPTAILLNRNECAHEKTEDKTQMMVQRTMPRFSVR